MATDPAPHPAAFLAEVRERVALVTSDAAVLTEAGFAAWREAKTQVAESDAPALLGALEAVLKEHRKMTVYGLSVRAHDNQEPPRVWCGHTYLETENSRHVMADDDSIVCLDKPEGDVCAECWEEGGEQAEWPCPTYRAISAALLGKGSGDG